MSMRATAHSAMIRTKTAIHSSTGEYSFKRHLKKWTIWDRKEQYKNAKEKKGQTDQLDLSPDRSLDKKREKKARGTCGIWAPIARFTTWSGTNCATEAWWSPTGRSKIFFVKALQVGCPELRYISWVSRAQCPFFRGSFFEDFRVIGTYTEHQRLFF